MTKSILSINGIEFISSGFKPIFLWVWRVPPSGLSFPTNKADNSKARCLVKSYPPKKVLNTIVFLYIVENLLELKFRLLFIL